MISSHESQQKVGGVLRKFMDSGLFDGDLIKKSSLALTTGTGVLKLEINELKV